MYTIILFYAIGYFFFLYDFYKESDGFDSYVIFFPLISSLYFACAGFIVAIVLPVNFETTKWQENLVTLKDNNSVSGNFFLGTGTINGQMKYVYYQQNYDSTYQMWQVDYFNAKIKYTDGQPKVNITDVRRQKSLWNKFAIDMDGSSQTYIFEVPKGSIKNSYELDAQ